MQAISVNTDRLDKKADEFSGLKNSYELELINLDVYLNSIAVVTLNLLYF